MNTLRVRMQLQRVRPTVWRRIEVPGSITLDRLHTVVHVAMGWSGVDGYEFSVGRSSRDPWRKLFVSAAVAEQLTIRESTMRGAPESPAAWEVRLDVIEQPCVETEVRLDTVLSAPGDVLLYRYGLAWEHRLRLEKILPGTARPQCVTGRRAVPANYLLNGWNYSALVSTARALAEGAEDDDAAGWLAGHFPGLSPAEVMETLEAFDVEQADGILEALDRAARCSPHSHHRDQQGSSGRHALTRERISSGIQRASSTPRSSWMYSQSSAHWQPG